MPRDAMPRDAMPRNTTGWLSTHVLDTANGCPAARMVVTLWQVIDLSEKDKLTEKNKLTEKDEQTEKDKQRLQPVRIFQSNYHHLKTLQTNQDGRTDSPLLEGDAFQQGTYEIVFAVSDYFSRIAGDHTAPLPESLPFLDLVPIRFSVADVNAHYHVPLLVSPWSYSTYRGS